MTFPTPHASAQAKYDPAPSLAGQNKTEVGVARAAPKDAGAIGIPCASDGEVPRELGLDRAALAASGFEGRVGQALVLPRGGAPALIAYGIGERAELDAAELRDAAAACARAAPKQARLAFELPEGAPLPPAQQAQAAVEGALLARYRYLSLKHAPSDEVPLQALALIAAAPSEAIERGARIGGVTARAAAFARDLANAPATLLTARRMAEIAQALAAECGLGIEVFDENALSQLGCGGMLGVNAGSDEPPRLIRLTHNPRGERGEPIEPVARVSLVGKGVMYDSGGISLKPNDLVHATMKGDMAGAAAVLAAMTALGALGCKVAVTAYLMCTDNMPSGSAMKLGDVLTVRGGTTVEVMNTDAEGRLIMADGLVMSTEQQPAIDAIVDIATLTGAAQRALGLQCAAVIGNHPEMVKRVEAAAARTDESVWPLPLDRRYRKELDSEIADLKNIGGDDAGAITAALFLEEFVGKRPWAHLDIAGTARAERDESWRPRGATGFGARLLIDLLMNFAPLPRAA